MCVWYCICYWCVLFICLVGGAEEGESSCGDLLCCVSIRRLASIGLNSNSTSSVQRAFPFTSTNYEDFCSSSDYTRRPSSRRGFRFGVIASRDNKPRIGPIPRSTTIAFYNTKRFYNRLSSMFCRRNFFSKCALDYSYLFVCCLFGWIVFRVDSVYRGSSNTKARPNTTALVHCATKSRVWIALECNLNCIWKIKILPVNVHIRVYKYRKVNYCYRTFPSC